MAWVVDKQSTQEELANRFRALVEANEILQIPGAHDAMAALVAKNTGFQLFIYRELLILQVRATGFRNRNVY